MTILILTALGIWGSLIIIKEFGFDRKARKQLYTEMYQRLDNIGHILEEKANSTVKR